MGRQLAVIQCKLYPIEDLSEETITYMWQLFDGHYERASEQAFREDLSNKQQAILLVKNKTLIGFTSQQFSYVCGYLVLYSGDIIITPNERQISTAKFFHTWARTVWGKCDWWCSLASGMRTHRIPHSFFKHVTPAPELIETDEERDLRNAFATYRYGTKYDRTTGIVKLKNPYVLKPNDASMRKSYPFSDFFQKANPGWMDGDELVSLVNLHPENWKPAALRMLQWNNKR